MPVVLVIDKNQSIKEVSLKQFVEEDLYKKAGFKSSEHFKCHAAWKLDINGKKYDLSLYGKTEGRANQENKYDFPPPADNILFFGSCLLLNKSNDTVSDLKESDWEIIYDHLFGGFEDIGSEDSDDEEEEIIEGPVTKEGYAKDGFVVDDDEVSEEKPKKKPRAKRTANKKEETVFAVAQSEQNEYLDCSSELSEEAYF